MKASNTFLSAQQKLVALLLQSQRCAIAVSGGVDSMTLAVMAHHVLGQEAQMFHAVSPAVPAAALDRVRHYSKKQGWNFVEIDANELDDENYQSNPADRCYFCKTNLYKTIKNVAADSVVILSGTNIDDLSDYRPGLIAANENDVRHPYVEVGIGKNAIRRLAKENGLIKLSELPSSPCLASRIETGIPIQSYWLEMIDMLENWLRQKVMAKNVRSRLRSYGVVIEIDNEYVDFVRKSSLVNKYIESKCLEYNINFAGFEPYIKGSAFLK